MSPEQELNMVSEREKYIALRQKLSDARPFTEIPADYDGKLHWFTTNGHCYYLKDDEGNYWVHTKWFAKFVQSERERGAREMQENIRGALGIAEATP